MSFLLGAFEMDITPKLPVQLAGFAHRNGKASEIHSPLNLKTFYFEQDGSAAVLLIGDVIWWDTMKVRKWKNLIHSKFGIRQEAICFHATHNHSGPQTSSIFTSMLGSCDHQYLDSLEDKIIKSIGMAIDNKEAVTISRRKTDSHIGVNRRKLEDGKIVMKPNVDAQVDRDLTVLSFEKENGEPKTVLIHFSCHPTSTDANVVSSEYPGTCCSIIQQSYPGAVVGFMQGCCGDIRPALVEDDQFFRGKLEDMEKVGNQLAADVLKLMAAGRGEEVGTGGLSAEVTSVFLPFQTPYSVNEKINVSLEALNIWNEHVNKHRKDYAELEIQSIRIGSELSFIAFNAEMVQGYGDFVKALSPSVLPIGYSNGMMGYVPTESQLLEGGYEAEEFIYYFGLPAPFHRSIEQNIHSSIKNILSR